MVATGSPKVISHQQVKAERHILLEDILLGDILLEDILLEDSFYLKMDREDTIFYKHDITRLESNKPHHH